MENKINNKLLNGYNIQFSPNDELLLAAYSQGKVGSFTLKIYDAATAPKFRFIKGMTWQEFINNFGYSDIFIIEGSYIHFIDSRYTIYQGAGVAVTINDNIINNKMYVASGQE